MFDFERAYQKQMKTHWRRVERAMRTAGVSMDDQDAKLYFVREDIQRTKEMLEQRRLYEEKAGAQPPPLKGNKSSSVLRRIRKPAPPSGGGFHPPKITRLANWVAPAEAQYPSVPPPAKGPGLSSFAGVVAAKRK